MRRATAILVALAVVTAISAVAAASASAELPEIGRCVLTEGTPEGKKTVYHAKYKNKRCTKESAGGNTGKYEFLSGPGPEGKEVETIAFMAAVTLETVKGHKIACTNHISFGELTGPKTETWKMSLRNCEDVNIKKPCQSFLPEKQVNETGRIDSQEMEATLGYISKAGPKPTVGWNYKAKTGSDVFYFECGETAGLGEKVKIEGSFIGAVKPVNKPVEEMKGYYKAPGGKQFPESFEGGGPSTMSALFINGLEMTTEQIGLEMPKAEEIIFAEELEVKA
jgi:hypothetical protein